MISWAQVGHRELPGDREWPAYTSDGGIGLGSAVLLDAFVVRTFLVPSLMHLLGRADWYLPGWLDRILPRLAIEGKDVDLPEPERTHTPT